MQYMVTSEEILEVRNNVESLETELAVLLDASQDGMDTLVCSALQRGKLQLSHAIGSLSQAHRFQTEVEAKKK